MTKKIEKKPIFDILYESGICFAVCVAENKFINSEIKKSSKDYFVIINRCDVNRAPKMTFYPSEGYKQICERSLTPDEIKIFKKNKDKFVKVLGNENGRIYELKFHSFKTIFDNINEKIETYFSKTEYIV